MHRCYQLRHHIFVFKKLEPVNIRQFCQNKKIYDQSGDSFFLKKNHCLAFSVVHACGHRGHNQNTPAPHRLRILGVLVVWDVHDSVTSTMFYSVLQALMMTAPTSFSMAMSPDSFVSSLLSPRLCHPPHFLSLSLVSFK